MDYVRAFVDLDICVEYVDDFVMFAKHKNNCCNVSGWFLSVSNDMACTRRGQKCFLHHIVKLV